MAFYKQPCIHCQQLIEADARFCNRCGSRSPFGYNCPTCLRDIKKGDAVCSGCGRPLYIPCPHCGGMTFVQDSCERCGKTLLVPCENKRCQQLQFFQNQTCTACGKKIRATLAK
jgi:RNA polymerase subunit RPABC4/transcription elongation factor Spt4